VCATTDALTTSLHTLWTLSLIAAVLLATAGILLAVAPWIPTRQPQPPIDPNHQFTADPAPSIHPA
jgi:hypothetical protein